MSIPSRVLAKLFIASIALISLALTFLINIPQLLSAPSLAQNVGAVLLIVLSVFALIGGLPKLIRWSLK